MAAIESKPTTQSPVYAKQSRGGPRTASVRIVSGGSQISGFITMTQADASSPVYVKGEVRGLRAGPHGFHIHEIGSTDGKGPYIKDVRKIFRFLDPLPPRPHFG